MSSAAEVTAPRDSAAVAAEPRGAWRRFAASAQGIAGMIMLGAVLLAGLAAPALTAASGNDAVTFHPELVDPANGGQPYGFLGGVSPRHWFGVEPATGRDLFSLVVYGIRTSVFIAVVATVISVTVGVGVGMVMGFAGGRVETVLGRFVDFMFGFPSLLFLISVMAIAPDDFPRPLLLALALSIFGWAGTARLIHGQAAQLRQRQFIDAAIASGTPALRVLVSELLPNLTGTVTVVVAIAFPGAVAAGAGLSFLGIGVGADTPEIGRLIGQSVTWTYTGADVGYLLFPGAVLFLLVLGSMLIGDALRDAFDVRTSAA